VYRQGSSYGDINPGGASMSPIWGPGGYVYGWTPNESRDPRYAPSSKAEVCTPEDKTRPNPISTPTPISTPIDIASGGDPFDYWSCRSYTMSYFALKQVSFGLIDLLNEGNPLSLFASWEGVAPGMTRTVRFAGSVGRAGSLVGDVMQLVQENKVMCRKATSYQGGF
jgi:hypothetical protein